MKLYRLKHRIWEMGWEGIIQVSRYLRIWGLNFADWHPHFFHRTVPAQMQKKHVNIKLLFDSSFFFFPAVMCCL